MKLRRKLVSLSASTSHGPSVSLRRTDIGRTADGYNSVGKVRCGLVWPWPSTFDLKNLSAIPTLVMNMCAKFHSNPFTEYRDIESRKIGVNGRTDGRPKNTGSGGINNRTRHVRSYSQGKRTTSVWSCAMFGRLQKSTTLDSCESRSTTYHLERYGLQTLNRRTWRGKTSVSR